MNSTEEISSYQNSQDYYVSPTFSKRATLGHRYDYPEKTVKKEKKWSIGSLFRRKKKEESESSSDEQQKRGFLGRRRRKSDGKRRKTNKSVGGFDHIVLPKTTQKAYNGYHEESGILSDPSGGFSNYVGRSLPLPYHNIEKAHSAGTSVNQSAPSVASAASIGSGDSISKKKGRELVKARAAARRTTLGNDSSSDEDSSLRSNSSLRVRSDESLARPQHDHNKRSRAARTERYLKRHSKDGENPHNYLRLSKSDVDRSPSRSPLPAKPKQKSPQIGINTIPPSHNKYIISNSTSNPSYKPPLSMNEYNNSINNHKSISCEANIHNPSETEQVLHVQFPILRPHNRVYRNYSLLDAPPTRQPPQPPPRDPNRTVLPSGRPTTVHFDNNPIQTRSKSFNCTHSNLSSGGRSTSEVHIPHDPFHLTSQVRPASTTPEPKPRYVGRTRYTVDGFNYLTDKKPRSRKPIVIQSATPKVEPRKDSPTQKALDFWKQIEDSVSKTCSSPQMFTSHTHVQSQVFPPRAVSPFKPVSPTVKEIQFKVGESADIGRKLSEIQKDEPLRKSTNLEEALDELEAIYNSLRLGDENLLDRAEQRENESLVKRAEQMKQSTPSAPLNNSCYTYETFDQVDSPKRKKVTKRGRIPDTKEDDMYNRKLAKEKSATISDPQGVMAKISYLMGSPLNHAYDSEGELKKINSNKSKEPDITFDDLGYRSVIRANASPKTVDPQPPFGIPLGPVSPAPPSDYLHAVPGIVYTPSYIPKKIPDVVKDDLAFRNLRKDPNKQPVLPSNNNNKSLDLNYLKKRRAVRSLSANIGNILGKEVSDSDNTLTDIADAMEIARRVLKDKEKKITETRKAFMSDSEVKPPFTNGDAFKESRMKFLSELKNTKVQPNSNNSSLDDLLNSLAEEAKVTTERINIELRELEAKRNKENELKPCQKLLKAVIDSKDLVEYSKVPCEVAGHLQVHSPPPESANLVQSCFKESSEERKDHDYETIDSDDSKIDIDRMEEEVKREIFKEQSPFQEHRDKIVASFQELNDGKKTDSIYDNLDDTITVSEGELISPHSDSNNTALTRSSTDSLKFDSLESLKSPKLVLETSRRCALMPKNSNQPGTSGSDFRCSDTPKKSQDVWYHDPAKVAVACSYGLACAHQLASIDLVTVLSLLFAVMSFIVALFL